MTDQPQELAAAAAAITLGDAERAAVMVMLLEEEQAARIVSQLGPDELQLLGEKMCALGEIGPDLIAQAIAGFVKNTERSGIGTEDSGRPSRNSSARAASSLNCGSTGRGRSSAVMASRMAAAASATAATPSAPGVRWLASERFM